MNHRKNSNNVPAALDRLIDEITVDAYGDDEQLWAFRQAFVTGYIKSKISDIAKEADPKQRAILVGEIKGIAEALNSIHPVSLSFLITAGSQSHRWVGGIKSRRGGQWSLIQVQNPPFTSIYVKLRHPRLYVLNDVWYPNEMSTIPRLN